MNQIYVNQQGYISKTLLKNKLQMYVKATGVQCCPPSVAGSPVCTVGLHSSALIEAGEAEGLALATAIGTEASGRKL